MRVRLTRRLILLTPTSRKHNKDQAITALIDGDIFIYQAAVASEHSTQWDDDLWTLHSFISEARSIFEDKLSKALEAVEVWSNKKVTPLIALSDPGGAYFRKTIWPDYKANRQTKRPPIVRRPLFDYVVSEYNTYTKPGLEGDDVLGILQTSPYIVRGQKIIVSSDKDFKTIPGLHFNMDKCEFFCQDPAMAAYFHMEQTLTGDSCDGYPGCPGIGPKKAQDALDKAIVAAGLDMQEVSSDDVYRVLWPIVLHTYDRVGLGEEYALTMSRLARICQRDDYNFKKKEVILWNPPA